MKIACYTLTYNEEPILPHFIKHYKQFCDKIVIYDNMSTDNTKQIALDNGCEVISWEANDGGGFNDDYHIKIKSNCYKQDRGKYDWAITVDCDEFYTHKNGVDKFLSILENYKKNNITLPKVQGFNMVGDESLNSIDSIFKINEGVKSISYSKRCIFNPIIDMMWSWGCHPQHGESYLTKNKNIVESEDTELLLLHYKFVNIKYVLNRLNTFKNRLSNFNKIRGLGIHYTYPEDKVIEEYNSLLEHKEKVLS